MNIKEHLTPDEQVISEEPPFYLTSHRILRLDPRGSDLEPMQLPLARITAIELTKAPSHPVMIAGTLIAVGGVVMASLSLYISAILMVVTGIGIVILGGTATPLVYQIRALNLAQQEEVYWRLRYPRCRSLIASLQNIIGEKLRPAE